MSRELNQGLFKDLSSPLLVCDKNLETMGSEVAKTMHQMRDESRDRILKELTEQVRQMKKRVMQQEQVIERLHRHIKAFHQSQAQMGERVSTQTQRLESFTKTSIKECMGRLAQYTAKLSDNKVVERQVQDMITRHNTVIQNFETRLNQMQKIIKEQEFKLMRQDPR